MNPRDVTVRRFSAEDVVDYRDYFCEGVFQTSLRDDFPPLSAEEKAAFAPRVYARLEEAARGGPPITMVTVLYRGKRVGVHPATHFEPGKSLVMHAHFFQPEARGIGIGTVSYVKAMDLNFQELDIKEILFKTPADGAGPMRIKEKLGLVSDGEEHCEWPGLARPFTAKVFRVTPGMMPALRLRAGIE